MCITAFAYQVIDKHPLILIANRDEYYHRPTEPLHAWNNATGIMAPKDLISKGSFIGYNQYGQWIVITNVRKGTHPDNQRSRGDIFSLYLQQKINANDFSSQLLQQAIEFNPFNALIGDTNELYYVSNHQPIKQQLSPGYYGLSNAQLDTPWPKLQTLKKHFKQTLEQPYHDDQLWSLLLDTTPAATEYLPNTGIPIAREKQLSSIFIQLKDYGTRSSYLLTQSNQLTLQERIYPTNKLSTHDSPDPIE